jgi:hypothetical protein
MTLSASEPDIRLDESAGSEFVRFMMFLMDATTVSKFNVSDFEFENTPRSNDIVDSSTRNKLQEWGIVLPAGARKADKPWVQIMANTPPPTRECEVCRLEHSSPWMGYDNVRLEEYHRTCLLNMLEFHKKAFYDRRLKPEFARLPNKPISDPYRVPFTTTDALIILGHYAPLLPNVPKVYNSYRAKPEPSTTLLKIAKSIIRETIKIQFKRSDTIDIRHGKITKVIMQQMEKFQLPQDMSYNVIGKIQVGSHITDPSMPLGERAATLAHLIDEEIRAAPAAPERRWDNTRPVAELIIDALLNRFGIDELGRVTEAMKSEAAKYYSDREYTAKFVAKQFEYKMNHRRDNRTLSRDELIDTLSDIMSRRAKPPTLPPPLNARPSPLNARPSPFNAHPPPFNAHPSPFNAHPPPLNAHPPPLNARPPPFNAEPSPFNAHPPPLNAHPPPLNAQPPPFNAHPPPLNAGPSRPIAATRLVPWGQLLPKILRADNQSVIKQALKNEFGNQAESVYDELVTEIVNLKRQYDRINKNVPTRILREHIESKLGSYNVT